jgi:hypothetical protein
MTNQNLLLCDGCGQAADSAHIAKRLKRLEWTTRFRPVHINTLLIGAVPPDAQLEFLYAPDGEFCGEALTLLDLAEISHTGKTREAVQADFQRAGFFLTYALECPLEAAGNRQEALSGLLEERAPQLIARIRRSLKPKRVALIAEPLNCLTDLLSEAQLGCQVILDGQKPFALDGAQHSEVLLRLRSALGVSPAVAR